MLSANRLWFSFVYFQHAGRSAGFTPEQENPNIKVASISGIFLYQPHNTEWEKRKKELASRPLNTVALRATSAENQLPSLPTIPKRRPLSFHVPFRLTCNHQSIYVPTI